MGQIQNQAYGYFFPHGAFFAVGELLHLPPWITQRLWWAILLTVGFIGAVRLAEALGVGSYFSRLVAAGVFAVSPRVITTLGTISSETLPMMLAPWALIPVVRALDRGSSRPLWREAARSACAVALMGAVNAVATAAAVGVAALWWAAATVRRDRESRRRGAVFGGWWLLGLAAACLWWFVPLLMLSRLSPPFLDYIESARVTTEWTGLTEVLRGTDSWTPFVSAERAAGAVLVSEPAAVLATGVLAAAGLAGLAMRAMPERRRLLTILVVGLLIICLGYPGALGSPIRDTVLDVLDGPGAALRNIHKFDPLLRLPLVLGVAHLLARVRVPVGSRRGAERGLAAALVVMVAAVGSGSLLWTGGIAPTASYRGVPDYWHEAADWLADAESGEATPSRALVVPGAPFADQLWGLTRDEPLQPLAQTPWAVRDAIPLTPPGAIRAMDSVQHRLVSGHGSPGLAATLTAQGVGYLVLRADLDPVDSRSARPLLVAQALRNSPDITEAAQFGPRVAPSAVDGFVLDNGLRPPMRAITIYRVGDGRAGPRLTDLTAMRRIAGGPESLAAVQDARGRAGLPPTGPTVLAADARRAGLPPAPLTVTDTPVDREVDFGRVDDHASALRTPGDPRRTKSAVADYPVDGQPRVRGQWLLDNRPGAVRVTSSGSASDATQPGRVVPASSPAAAFDGDGGTAWASSGLDSAVGRWLGVEFTEPRSGLAVTVTTAKALGPDVSSLLITTDSGSTVAQGVKPGVPVRVLAPPGPTRSVQVRAIDTADGSGGNQFAIAELSLTDAATGTPLSIRQRTVLPTLDAADRVSDWVLTDGLGGRPDCVADESGRVRCAPTLGAAPEEAGVYGRTLSVPDATDVTPVVTLRPRPGGELAALLARHGTVAATGPSWVTDPRGNASAAVDGDAGTTWTAPEPTRTRGKKAKQTKPSLTLTLPAPRRVDGVRLRVPTDYPARPTRVTVEVRDGDRRVGSTTARVGADGTVRLPPRTGDSVVLTVERSSDLIDVNDLGFASEAPVGISEVTLLPRSETESGDTESGDRPVTIRCDADPLGPYGLGVTASGTVHRLRVDTTVGALRRGEPITATACPGPPLHLAAGEQEVSVNPGGAFTVEAVTLTGPDGPPASAPTAPVHVDRWDAVDRAVRVDAADRSRVLSVPESTNPGWHARIGDAELSPIVVDGWQQGWIIPAGVAGTIALTFDLDTPYRWVLGVGLALVALLFAAAWFPLRRRAGSAPETGPRASRRGRAAAGTVAAAAAGLSAAFLLTGPWGAAIAGATGLLVHRLPPPARVWTAFSAMLGATLVLASGPWHSGTAYAGYSAWGQSFALIAVAAAVASAFGGRDPRDSRDP